jgi:predicted O-methyltransferase YrrM
MKIKINKNDVKKMDLSTLFEYAMHNGNNDYIHFINEAELDRHALRLYAYLSTLFNDSVLLDVGTKFGNSAIAFSYNESNKVITYDIVEWPCHSNLKKNNIELKIENFMEDKTINYDNVSIILIDVDPHDGTQEPVMLKHLEEIGWSGLLLFDDIAWDDFPEMKKIWSSIEYEKYELTDVGHFSGTGLVNFGNKYDIQIVEG